MEIKERRLIGCFEITLMPHKDSRGFFMRTFDSGIFKEYGLSRKWVQENHSQTIGAGTIRGLHMQLPPYSETKLVRCISGAVLDVFVDLRVGSETFGQWDKVELNQDNKKMILIPRGFAHGFCTITEFSEILYKVDNYYSKEKEVGIIWNDPNLNIDWGIQDPKLSLKDSKNLTFNQFKGTYGGVKI